MASQRMTALLLLVVSLVLPVAPLLQAGSTATKVCQCCRRKCRDACRRSHAMPASGPGWNASPYCARGCGQPACLAFSPQFLSPGGVQAGGLLPQRGGLSAAIPVYRFFTSYAAWRYQRPPPLPLNPRSIVCKS